MVFVSLLALSLVVVFRHVEQNYVVGIRNMWTLQSMHMWKDTHFVASVAFGVASGVGIVLVFYVLQ